MDPMIIIGLTGGIGHGKSTFAKYLTNSTSNHGHWESGEVISEVASLLRTSQVASPRPADLAAINSWLHPLPLILEQTVHIRLSAPIVLTQSDLTSRRDQFTKLLDYLHNAQAEPARHHELITPHNKELIRPLLQWLGGYLAKTVSDDIWYQEIMRRIQATPNLQLATIGGVRFPADAKCVRAAGGKIISITRPRLEQTDLQDLTERERSLIQVDSIIYNDATLAQLAVCAQQVYADLISSRLAQEYRASAVTS
jgi:hypothetical protein